MPAERSKVLPWMSFEQERDRHAAALGGMPANDHAGRMIRPKPCARMHGALRRRPSTRPFIADEGYTIGGMAILA